MMGIRIEVDDGEPIADAVRRFRRLIQAEGAFPLYHCKWHKKRNDFFVKPSTLNRRRRWIVRVRRRGRGFYNPDPALWWADDLLAKPGRSWGPAGRDVHI